ncbi:MAG: TIGR00304 family membrane protein [Thermoplasmata archaeon]
MIFFGQFQLIDRTLDHNQNQESYTFENEEKSDNIKNKKTSFGGLIMIGPVPIVFGNDRRMVYVLLGIAAVILLIIFIRYFR